MPCTLRARCCRTSPISAPEQWGHETNCLRGTTAANTLRGTAGADLIDGLAGDDLIDGGRGNDHLVGGPGNDIFLFCPGDGLDRIVDAEAGDRILVVGEPVFDLSAFRVGNDLAIQLYRDPDYNDEDLASRIVVLDFFAGRRIGALEGDFSLQNLDFQYSSDASFSEVFFSGGATPGLQAGIDQGNALEFIFGTDEDDRLEGNGGLFDYFRPGLGNDEIVASAQVNFFRDEANAGDDIYTGSAGIDRIRAGRGGNDVYDGGGGAFDRVDYRDSLEAIRIDLAFTGPQLISAIDGARHHPEHRGGARVVLQRPHLRRRQRQPPLRLPGQ
ncbi:MAG: calcium-binding protein [Acetobacteraceae bacterium]|nr:calcium-binding protein [Acetobacteraceae bacterium]